MTPTTALAVVKPADAAIEDSATFCLTSAITCLRAASGSDQGCGRQCSETTSAACCPLRLLHHGNANDLHVRARLPRGARTAGWQFLLRERREPSTSEQREGCFGTPAPSCAPRAQDANASKRLPICARMIVEQAHRGSAYGGLRDRSHPGGRAKKMQIK